jgi:CDP-diacylglycerol--serine O-phosphatidyltransferase
MAPVFLYVSGGAIRLARYNVDAERKPGPVKNFTGLPVPGAAGCVAGLVLGLLEEGRALGPGAAAGLLAGLGLLMVSTVKYRKKMELREPAAAALVALALVVLAVTAAVAPAYTVLALFGFYIAAGLAEAVLVQLFRLRRFLVHGKSDRESPGR